MSAVPKQNGKMLNSSVCDTDGPAILGLTESKALNLVSVNPLVEHVTVSIIHHSDERNFKDTHDLIAKFPDRFEGLGKFEIQGKLQLKDNARPVVNAPRRCPVHIKQDIQTEIDAMEAKGIIEKISPRPAYRMALKSCVCKKTKWQAACVCLDAT